MAADPPRVSVIIPAARNPELLTRCLQSLVAHSGTSVSVETIVVLNRASDAVAEVARRAQGVHSISSRANLGTGVAWNLARTAARGELLAMIHDDVEVEAGWLDPLVEVFDARPEVGAAGSLVLNPDGSLQAAGWVLWRDGTTSPPWLIPPPVPGPYTEPFPVDYLPGCALLTRRASFDAVGGADERFYPAYGHDVDLCTAIRARGQLVVCDPRSRVRHRLGSTSGPRLAAWLSSRNRVRFAEKWREELREYASFEPGSAEALARAQARTAAEAERISAAPPRGPHRGQGVPAKRLRRAPVVLEERWLLASVELQSAYAAALSADLDRAERRLADAVVELQAAGHERAALRAQVAALEPHVTALGAELEVMRAQGAERGAELGAVRAQLGEREAVLVQLAEREAEVEPLRWAAAKLTAIEAGGWWRLRGQILPLLALAGRVRRLLARSDPSERT